MLNFTLVNKLVFLSVTLQVYLKRGRIEVERCLKYSMYNPLIFIFLFVCS